MLVDFWVRVVWVLAALTVGCAGLPAVPDKGGPPWRRLESAYFVLYTDQSEPDARNTIAQFDSLLSAYYQVGWDMQGRLPVKLEALVFDDSAHFEVFSGDRAGYYDRRPPLAPLVVMPSGGRLDRWSTLKHELTHFIALQSLPFQPRWFAEGLACYFQSANFDLNDQFVIGDVPAGLHDTLTVLRPLPARELLADASPDGQRFYATAWLLVHYLMSARGEAFAKYQNGLYDGQSSNDAWAAAFPDLPVDRVDAVLQRYFQEGRYSTFARSIQRDPVAAASVRVLSSADVYALRARLYLGCPGCSDEPRRQAELNIEQALRLEPTHLGGSVLRYSFLSKSERLQFAQGLVRAHPKVWLTYWMLAGAELGAGRCSPEVVAHLRELGAHSAYALMMAGTCEAAAGARQDALELTGRALRMQPADTQLLILRAAVLLATHDCPALQSLLPRIRNAVHVQAESELLAKFAACEAQ
jgi:hypothetical protein